MPGRIELTFSSRGGRYPIQEERIFDSRRAKRAGKDHMYGTMVRNRIADSRSAADGELTRNTNTTVLLCVKDYEKMMRCRNKKIKIKLLRLFRVLHKVLSRHNT